MPEGIGFVTIGLRPQAAAFQESGDLALNVLGHTGYFGIAGRRSRAEANAAHFVLSVDAVERQGMEMNIQIQNSM